MHGLLLVFYVAGLTLRPYTPPVLDPDPAFTPSTLETVEILPATGDWDANVFARPHYAAPMVGHIARGTRVRVRGELKLQSAPYCPTRLYYALEPFGWLCSADTKPTAQPATTESVLSLVPGTPVPYRYAMVVVEEGTYLPMWRSLQDLWNGAEPERQLARGDTLALGPTLEKYDGESYFITVDEKVVPVKGTIEVKNYSAWQGEVLTEATHLPFGWVTPFKGAGVRTRRRARRSTSSCAARGSTYWKRCCSASSAGCASARAVTSGPIS